jgi:uncharacterized protein (DUF305 family)
MNDPHGAARTPGFQQEMQAAMETMTRAMQGAPMVGDADRDFLAMMIPHHQGAIDMAKLVLVHGRDPLVRQLATEIMASQQVEIIAMRGRVGALGRAPDDDYPALHGTRGPMSR